MRTGIRIVGVCGGVGLEVFTPDGRRLRGVGLGSDGEI